MAAVRCYVPLGVEELGRLHDERHLSGPLPATAVTEAVRAANTSGDVEDWEHAALQAAAHRQLAASRPVLVAAVDLASELVDTAADGPGVQVAGIDLPRVASLHLGDDVVTGTPDALGEVGPDDEIELSWYDTTEIAHVLELARALTGALTDD